MNFHKLVNFEEFLLSSEHSSVQVRWTYVSTICGHKMPVMGGMSASSKCQADLMHDCKCQAELM